MHEFSLIQNLLQQCEYHAEQAGSHKVLAIHVSIGMMAGVEPELFKRAYDTFRQQTVCSDAELEIHWQPLELFCLQCASLTSLHEPRYSCQQCGSTSVRVEKGEDILLMRLEME
ncbi:hydrogenase maturation nickel metallochaperone HypA [Desulfurispirillum indicum]|uniref:Hydrogenase maturation factor HypA n=1 Tax=Desulfurispirillum indicum (strain ATCC BAA-1389 / DSM 22839 / S5) TaxID=653733 RepID=E6W2N3_DESIS|nr:hydrogenase maturation nickel metallochaperone HypA [Desulfurispirillum indicum]ADU65617.1 hydrogenase expression/synthesis HypA [Desulfurispirillum indicum S5]UCZ57548.1 hydrogenase maturation nickel metallochaperone HypA [Desulfurispirillum indicum]